MNMKFLSSIAGVFLAASALSLSTVAAIEEGDSFPADLTLHHGFPPKEISLDDRIRGKNVIVVGLPGAFTPT